MRYRLFGLCFGLLFLAAAACGGGSSSPTSTESPASTEVTPDAPAESPTPAGDPQDPVAIVNDEEITREEFEAQLGQAEASYEQQGRAFPTGEQLSLLKQEILDQLVRQTLVLQEADSRSITASEEEVQSQYQAAASNFPDEQTFQQALEEQGLTQEDIEGLIADSIKAEKLLRAVVEESQLAPPSEEDLRTLYEQSSQQQDLPPFEEVRSQLEAQVQNQQQGEVIENFIEELESSSTIEVLLAL